MELAREPLPEYKLVEDTAKRAWSRWSVVRVYEDGTEKLIDKNLGKGEALRTIRILRGEL